MNQKLDPLDILTLVLEGEASDEQRQQLIEALRHDESLRHKAARINAIHGQLGVVMEDEVSSERRIMQVIKTVKEADSDQFEQSVRTKILKRKTFNRSLVGGAIAAVLALGLFGVFFFNPNTPTPLTEKTTIVATLKRTDGVQWVGSIMNIGHSLAAGQSLHIQSGLLELDLAGRGRLIVEGPAQLDFPKDGLAILHQGRIVMRATEKGHGYRIKTPQGCIIDLGTEFGVSVGKDGLVETHVIDGSVEAIPHKGKRVTLFRNNALKMDAEGSRSITADTGQFYTLMPPLDKKTANHIYWGLNSNKGLSAQAKGVLVKKAPNNNADLIFHSMDKGTNPSWVNGVVDSALHFDGRGGYAESDYPGIGGGKARTVCFWVKVPKDFSTRQGFGILSWGSFLEKGRVWQVSVNPISENGPMGRLRVGLHGGQVIGSTDLRDGQWHHIAVVLYGGSKPNIGTHVLLYVDGKKEEVSRRALMEVKTKIKDAKHGVWLGRNITYTHSTKKHLQGGFFRGNIDEVYIFEGALSQEQVLGLMTH